MTAVPPAGSADVAEQFLHDSRTFLQKTRELGLPDVSRFYWYHTVDLGGGLITPGLYDYRDKLDCFGFPSDMAGKTVLDVGPATGFFAFEFERRGARVTTAELPSLLDLDRFPGQDVENSLRKIERMIYPDGDGRLRSMRREETERDLYWNLLEGPFQFCRERLRSAAERRYCTVYDVSLEALGAARPFDMVFVGDVLVHTLYPMKALAAAASVCAGTLVLAQLLPEGPQEPPAMQYVGGDDPAEDHISWFLPNLSCLRQLLRKLGFARVEEAGWHRGVLRPAGHPFERIVLHAHRQ